MNVVDARCCCCCPHAARAVQSIETYLKDAPFDNAKVAGWVNSICEDCIHGLVDLGKPFKYIGEQIDVCNDPTPTPLYPCCRGLSVRLAALEWARQTSV